MKGKLLTTLTVLAILVLSAIACGEDGDPGPGKTPTTITTPSIVGEWAGTSIDGRDRMTLNCRDDGTLIWTVDSPVDPSSTTAQYSVDYATRPVQIDIFGFSLPDSTGFVFLGIIEFTGNERPLFYGQMSYEGDTSRPKEFGPDAFALDRVKY